MKIIKASSNIINTDHMSHLTMMEVAGRICYRSEDKITETSAKGFCKGIIQKKHKSVTEFALFTFRIQSLHIIQFMKRDYKYLIIDRTDTHTVLVTGTARAFREAVSNLNNECEVIYAIIAHLKKSHTILFEDILNKPFDPKTKIHLLSISDIDKLYLPLKKRHRWIMVKHITNRAVSHELVRHRPVSWLQESQRYCRYSDSKFGNEVTFIDPRNAFEFFGSHVDFKNWEYACKKAEEIYLDFLDNGASPQAARTVLPNSCKTELYQLCNLEEWEIFFGLRTSPAAEPSMREIIIPLYEQFKKRFPDIFK